MDLEDLKRIISDPEDIAQELAKTLNLPYYNLKIFKPEQGVLTYVDEETAKRLKILPLKKIRDILVLGICDPYNEEIISYKDALEKKYHFKIELAIISLASLDDGLKEYELLKERQKKISYSKTFEIKEEAFTNIRNNVNSREDFQRLLTKLSQDDPFLILDYLIAGAVFFSASDVHFEPFKEKINVRFRLDGVLYQVHSLSKKNYDLLKNRIKVLSELMINVQDKPQDGRFSFEFEERNIDVRVSIVPAFDGESISLRILDFSQMKTDLALLGLRDDDLEILQRAISSSAGLILNCGPTGSGKTTTLYSILKKIYNPGIKIITIEDPIEYKVEGISQTQINEENGYTFSVALKSFLRHDPDVILVGEIRDTETATTAIQAALTGHLVLSTLHAKSSIGVIPRLLSMKVDFQLVSPALKLIINQRLIRKICSYCHETYKPDEILIKKIVEKLKALPSRVKFKFDLNNFNLVKARGCAKCFATGYKGRTGIFELLEVNKELESLILKNPSEIEIFELVKNNFVDLQQDGLIRCLAGITTVEEIEKKTTLL